MQIRLIVLFLFSCILTAGAQKINITKKYKLEKLGDGVNTRHEEASPVISPDGKTLYFFVQNHPENTYGDDQFSQDIWMSTLGQDGPTVWMGWRDGGAHRVWESL